jgi:hypothetical protein
MSPCRDGLQEYTATTQKTMIHKYHRPCTPVTLDHELFYGVQNAVKEITCHQTPVQMNSVCFGRKPFSVISYVSIVIKKLNKMTMRDKRPVQINTKLTSFTALIGK